MAIAAKRLEAAPTAPMPQIAFDGVTLQLGGKTIIENLSLGVRPGEFLCIVGASGCGSKRLLAAHSDLYDQAYRYRRVMMSSIDSGKNFVRAHQLLADRIIARDVPGSQAMLEAHLRSTLNFVYPPSSES